MYIKRVMLLIYYTIIYCSFKIFVSKCILKSVFGTPYIHLQFVSRSRPNFCLFQGNKNVKKTGYRGKYLLCLYFLNIKDGVDTNHYEHPVKQTKYIKSYVNPKKRGGGNWPPNAINSIRLPVVNSSILLFLTRLLK